VTDCRYTLIADAAFSDEGQFGTWFAGWRVLAMVIVAG